MVLTWSAGNEGPGSADPALARRPRHQPHQLLLRGLDPAQLAPYTISGFSSRGPSGCGGEYAIKPEICAPGSDIYSVRARRRLQYKSGTSMAGPHVAGVVALMRAAIPTST